MNKRATQILKNTGSNTPVIRDHSLGSTGPIRRFIPSKLYLYNGPSCDDEKLYHRLHFLLLKIIIIIIAPLTIVKEDQWGDLECLHKACQAAKTDGGLFTDTSVDERCENERQGENDCEMKTVRRIKRPENRQELV